jgi:hypothetical protein
MDGNMVRTTRRGVLTGLVAAGGVLLLPGCQTLARYSLEDAVERLLFLSSERAFARLTEPGAFWDRQVEQAGLGEVLGTRGDVISRVLTSPAFKARLEDRFADLALEASERAAPVVTDAVEVVGIANARAIIDGGPRAATIFLRREVGAALIEAMVPELADAMRIAEDPLVAELVSAAIGTDIIVLANRLAASVNDIIWNEIGREEAAIRDDPRSTGDPVLAEVLGAARF